MPKVTADFTFKGFAPEVKRAMHNQIMLGLQMVGETAEGYAKDDCPVATGRLRNSIAWATKDATGNTDVPANPEDSKPKATPEDLAVYIGTNVEYAEFVEYNEKSRHNVGQAHFLRDAVTNHGKEFARLMELALKTSS